MVNELRDRYENEVLKSLIRVLERPEWKLWNEKGIQWIIQQCDNKIRGKRFLDSIRPFAGMVFSAVLMPLVLFFLELIAKDQTEETLLLFIGGISIVGIMVISMAWIVYVLLVFQKDSSQNTYRRLREDLWYLLLRF